MTIPLLELIIDYTYTTCSPPSCLDYDYLHKLLLIADANAGKTCINSKFIADRFITNYTPTIGVDFKIKRFDIDQKSHALQIWDTSGQQRFKTITTSYYKGANGIFIVFDITNKTSFDSIKTEWISQLARSQISNECILILIGCKYDLVNEREVSINEAKQWCKILGCSEYIEVSAADDENNINYMFEQMVRYITSDAERRKIAAENAKLIKELDAKVALLLDIQ